MTDEERHEALHAIVCHFGMPAFLSLIDEVIEKVKRGILSTPLDIDPSKAMLTLYMERMKCEGAVAVKNALIQQIKLIKGK